MASTLHTQYIPRLDTYDRALAHYTEKAAEHPRIAKQGYVPLGKPSQKDLKVIKDYDGCICIRYHATDVVVHHPDRTVLLTPWESRNTELVVNEVMGRRLHVCYESMPLGYGAIVLPVWSDELPLGYWKGESDEHVRVYALARRAWNKGFVLSPASNGALCIDPDDTQPVRKPRIDRKASKAAYATTNLADYTAFFNAAKKLKAEQSRVCRVADASKLTLLATKQYIELYYNTVTPEELRRAILAKHPECIVVDEVPYIGGTEFDAVRKAQTTYKGAMR